MTSATAIETKAAVELTFASAGMRMTPGEFDAIAEWDDEYRYQLIDGVLVVSPIPGGAQVGPNEYLGYLLNDYRYTHPEGAALDDTLPERYIYVANGRRICDRVIWAGLGRRPDPKADPPTVGVEFVSAGKRNRDRDYVEKREEYIAAGVVEYWVVDRFDRTMSAFHEVDGDLIETIVTEDETYQTDLLPGFKLVLADLLRVADRYADE